MKTKKPKLKKVGIVAKTHAKEAPDVMRDLDDFFTRVAPEDDALYRHTAEGPDDMPAHIRAALTASQLSIPVAAGHMALGTWQGIYVLEPRHGRFSRDLALHFLGE